MGGLLKNGYCMKASGLFLRIRPGVVSVALKLF
jgi:hypothetical protein